MKVVLDFCKFFVVFIILKCSCLKGNFVFVLIVMYFNKFSDGVFIRKVWIGSICKGWEDDCFDCLVIIKFRVLNVIVREREYDCVVFWGYFVCFFLMYYKSIIVCFFCFMKI